MSQSLLIEAWIRGEVPIKAKFDPCHQFSKQNWVKLIEYLHTGCIWLTASTHNIWHCMSLNNHARNPLSVLSSTGPILNNQILFLKNIRRRSTGPFRTGPHEVIEGQFKWCSSGLEFTWRPPLHGTFLSHSEADRCHQIFTNHCFHRIYVTWRLGALWVRLLSGGSFRSDHFHQIVTRIFRQILDMFTKYVFKTLLVFISLLVGFLWDELWSVEVCS